VEKHLCLSSLMKIEAAGRERVGDAVNIPIYEALLEYCRERNVLLHMPGHKGGRGFTLSEFQAVGMVDFTEVPGLDDLHNPRGVLSEAQRLAAEAWGAERSLFLVNGATSGIQCLLLALGEESRVLLPRNAHRSFLGGLVISGARPIFVECEMDATLGVALSVRPESIRAKLSSCSGIKGAFLVSPTYYGTVNEIKEIAELLLEWEIPLMVDEAHGSHFIFHPGYPRAALQEGAQASVHGLHKTMPVLTQAGILHLGAGFPWSDRVQACHGLLTSTSPSYPLMASIDIGRATMQKHGRELLEQAKERTERCRRRINGIPGFVSRSWEFLETDGVAGYDPLKLLVEITGLDLDGYQLSRLLREHYGIQVELAGDNHVLAMFSPFNRPDDWDNLAVALSDISQRYAHRSGARNLFPGFPPIPPLAFTPRESFLSPHKTVKIEESKGMISAEMAAPYPPGIPCIIPGEIITAEVVEYLIYLKQNEIPVQGLQDRSLQSIQVVNV